MGEVMVTKQEQLEWLAKTHNEWSFIIDHICMSSKLVGFVSYGAESHMVTKQEWQKERDKMKKRAEQPAQDNSWHERGELPPVDLPVELWVCGSFAYNCELISKRGNNYVLWNLDSDKADSADYMHSQFRPLRTEREKAIEEMVKAIDHIKEGNFETFIGALYDAGYRKVSSK